MALLETPNTVTVGTICYSCALFVTKECPYQNFNKVSALEFKGDIRGKCIYWTQVVQSGGTRGMKKSAQSMNDTELNMALYKMIMASSKEQQKYLLTYWQDIYKTAPEYAKEMVSDDIETGQRCMDNVKRPKLPKEMKSNKHQDRKENKFPEPFKSNGEK